MSGIAHFVSWSLAQTPAAQVACKPGTRNDQILVFLGQAPEKTIIEIGSAIGITPSAAYQLLYLMLKNNLVVARGAHSNQSKKWSVV